MYVYIHTACGFSPLSDSASMVGVVSNKGKITSDEAWALAASGANALACPKAIAPNTMAENTLKRNIISFNSIEYQIIINKYYFNHTD